MPRRAPLPAPRCGRDSGRPGWLPVSGTRGSSLVPSAGRALAGRARARVWRGARVTGPRAQSSGMPGAARGAVPGADGSSALAGAARPPGGLGAPPTRPAPCGAPSALRLFLGRSGFHNVGIWSQAEAAAYPQWGKSLTLVERLVLIFKMGS